MDTFYSIRKTFLSSPHLLYSGALVLTQRLRITAGSDRLKQHTAANADHIKHRRSRHAPTDATI